MQNQRINLRDSAGEDIFKLMFVSCMGVIIIINWLLIWKQKPRSIFFKNDCIRLFYNYIVWQSSSFFRQEKHIFLGIWVSLCFSAAFSIPSRCFNPRWIVSEEDALSKVVIITSRAIMAYFWSNNAEGISHVCSSVACRRIEFTVTQYC